MKKQNKRNSKRWRVSAYGVAFLLLMMAGCDNLTNTDHSVKEQVDSRTIPGNLFGSTITDSYLATVLPSNGLKSSARLIADNDNVFGSINENYHKAVKWTIASNGEISEPVYLGELPEPWHEADQHLSGRTNNGDIVVGWAGQYDHVPGWVWTNGKMSLLPEPEYTTRVWAKYVSGEGLIVGSIDLYNGEHERYGAVWFPPYDTAPILLPLFEDYDITTARAIDPQGKVIGWARASGLPDILIQWQIDSEGNILSGPDKLEGIENVLFSEANQSLDVIGAIHPMPFLPYLFKSDSEQKIELGLLDGHISGAARGLNERKQDGSVQVVGYSSPESSLPLENLSAVLWSVDASNVVTGPIDLGLPDRVQISSRPPRFLDFVSASAYSINNKNWIAGTSTREDGKEFATIWQPISDDGDGDEGEEPAPPSGDLTASFDYNCSNTATCEFTDTSTGDIIESRTWDPAGIADDGKHTFTAGEHTVTLTITDSGGNSASASETINCRSHPRHGVRCS